MKRCHVLPPNCTFGPKEQAQDCNTCRTERKVLIVHPVAQLNSKNAVTVREDVSMLCRGALRESLMSALINEQRT